MYRVRLARKFSTILPWSLHIGLEIHAQLASKEKLFSVAKCPPLDLETQPNSNIAPLDSAFPGYLPYLNKDCLELAIRAALVLNCQIQPKSIFDRKHYFYPDLPLGYQITQSPFAKNGGLKLETGKVVRIKQIQLEQDSGKSIHNDSDNVHLIDLNRAGIGLVEIVTFPDLQSIQETIAFAKCLRDTLIDTQICQGNMELGQLRFDVNVSVSGPNAPKAAGPLGRRVEIKNLNSFGSIQNAIAHEYDRQVKILAAGGMIEMETRAFDAKCSTTSSLRTKELIPEYRYIKDADIPELVITDNIIERVQSQMPISKQERHARLISRYSLTMPQICRLEKEDGLLSFYQKVLESNSNAMCDSVTAYNWIVGELVGRLHQKELTILESPVSPPQFRSLLDALNSGQITGKAGKLILMAMINGKKEHAETIASQLGLLQTNSPHTTDLADYCQSLAVESPEKVREYLAGKRSIDYFMGPIMKKYRGIFAPQMVKEILIAILHKQGPS